MKKEIDLTKVDGLLWDVDGVLIDVSKSYREAIRKTVSYILKTQITKQEVDEIKDIVGLNNDWDASYALILKKSLSGFDTKEFVANILEYRKDEKYKEVFDTFQSFYLGSNLYKKVYSQEPILFVPGLIEKEELMIPTQKLIQLKAKYKKMGIVTGRPRFEAEYAFKINSIGGFFNTVVAMEDTVYGKPSADPINLAIKSLNLKSTLYIGDSPSDVAASRAADIPSIFIGKQKLGDMNFSNISKLIKYLL